MTSIEAVPPQPKPSPKSRILLIDDHPIVRHGLGALINEEADMMVCGEAGTTQEALTATHSLQPDVVVLDLSLGHENGLTLLKDIHERHPQLPVLILSMHEELLYAERALHAGARGYVTKQQDIHNVPAAIRRVLAGDIYLNDQMSTLILSRMTRSASTPARPLVDSLTDRELEIFRLIGRGIGNQDIAAQLRLSVKTIESHRENIKRKLRLGSSAELLRFAVEWMRKPGP